MLTMCEVRPKHATNCSSDLRCNQVTEGRRFPPYEAREQQPRGVTTYPAGFKSQSPARFAPGPVTVGVSIGCVLRCAVEHL